MNYIILVDNIEVRSNIANVLKRFLFNTNEYYKIIYNDKYKSIKSGINIYLIDMDNNIDIAKQIRENDLFSPIIFLSTSNKFIKNIQAYDVIKKDKSMYRKIFDNIKKLYEIFNGFKSYKCVFHNEIHRILYKDILYIEKKVNDDKITIYTEDNVYTEYASIKNILDTLSDDARFFKTHRSMIINLFKVDYFDKNKNMIILNNGTGIDLIARNKRKELEDKMNEYNLISCFETIL